MSPLLRVALLLAFPFVWLGAALFAVILVAIDLLCWPFVLLLRRAPADEPPRSRNASVVVLNWNGIGYLREGIRPFACAAFVCRGRGEGLFG